MCSTQSFLSSLVAMIFLISRGWLENLKAKKDSIYKEICKEAHSIESLSKKTKIKRSTLNYYLNQLLDENKIYKERLKNFQGEPNILRPIEGNEGEP